MEVKVYPEFDFKMNFDGCSKGNPGLSGAGYVIYHKEKEIVSESKFIGNNYTNNYAEYFGLICGLQKAISIGITRLYVEGDSLLVINQMKGLYKCNSKNLIELFNFAKELERKFEYISFNHVLRNKNKKADELSNLALVLK